MGMPYTAGVLCRARAMGTLVGVALLGGCGGGGGGSSYGPPPPPSTYTVGGSVSGLSGAGLVLQNNGGNNLMVAATATSFTFSTAPASRSDYSVAVLTQPSNPAQS